MAGAELEFARLVSAAEADPRVVGLLLGGSRGKDASYVTDASDYDVYVIVDGRETLAEYAERFPSRHGDRVEVVLMTLDGFREHGLHGSGTEWNAYTFAHVMPVLDKLDGEVASLAAEKGKREPASAAPDPLDGYINLYYRAAKNRRDGLVLEAHLDAAESIAWLLEFVFRACGRVRPFNKWLRWELANHPLPDPWEAGSLERRLQAIVATGDIAEQQGLFRDVESFARERGFGDVIDAWEPDLQWLRGSE